MLEPQLSSLEGRAIRGVFWSAAERLMPQAVQFIISIILARLLLPEQFGLIGMLAVFLAVGQVFINSGFGSALIQKQDADEIHFSSVFYTNLLISIVAAGILILVAPLIARFFREPILISLTRALSFNFIISAFGLVQVYLLTKKLDFKTQMKVSLLASLGSGVVGVSLAFHGYGVWSLVIQNISATFFNTLLLWIFNTWRPRKVFSLSALRELFGFGSRLLASGLMDTIFRNIYNVVIGKLFSPADLGFYARAYSLQQLPSETLGGIIGRVTFPIFSEIQNDPVRMKNAFRKVLRSIALINFPMMIGLLVCARPLILVLLTEKWSPATPYLQMLSIVGLIYPLHLINLNVLLAKGRSDLFFRLEVIKKSLIVIVLAITWRWGVFAIIAGQIVLSFVAYYLNSFYNGVIMRYGIREQGRDLLPYLIASGAMGGVVFGLNWLPIAHPTVLLMIQMSIGSLFYLLICRVFQFPIFMDSWRLLKGNISDVNEINL